MAEADLDAADRVMRVAFGTFLGLPDPAQFGGDADYARGRFRADPSSAFVAEQKGEVVGSNFATRWGRVGFFGPLSVRTDLQNGGIAKRLLEPVMDCFEAWGITHAGLFTFAHSAKHLALYERFGFHARFLTAIMAAPVRPETALRDDERWPPPPTFAATAAAERPAMLADCSDLADAIQPGLDLGAEIDAVRRLGLGDTVFLPDPCGLGGFAVCHCGPGTEAGGGSCFVKFAMVSPGAGAAHRFAALLEAVEAFARARGLERIVAGTSLARSDAYALMRQRGFRTMLQGVCMHRPNEPGYHRADVYAIDDWR
jgi:predicted N-acetyltransferase YhbS